MDIRTAIGMVGTSGFSKQTSHVILQVGATKPVAAETVHVVSLKAGDPPRTPSWDLFSRDTIFIDDWCNWVSDTYSSQRVYAPNSPILRP